MRFPRFLRRFFSSRARVDLPVVLDRKRIFILPTKSGFSFALLLLALLVGSINYNNNLGFLLTFLLAGTGFVSIFHTYVNLRGFEIFRIDTGETFAPDPAVLTVHCRSGSRAFRNIQIFMTHDPFSGSGLRLEPGKTRIASLVGSPSSRGIHPLPRIVVQTSYPLGLFRAWSVLAVRGEYAVFPEPGGAVSFFSRETSGDSDQDLGPGRRSGSDDFHGVREYVPGDPVQRIAWKASSKGSTLLTREFVTGSRRHQVLRWEDVQGTDEERLSLLCAMVLAAAGRGVPYRLELPGYASDMGTGPGHRRRCLKRLAEF
ncbi:MAG TPA: DUF58 domain-containing protein [Desulfomicrobiaceae bacterium]|nr:DUF58 domain-containing protein [Desulfomicrobiaceae bacterium]